MADLFWPGDERAGSVFDADSFLRSLVEVEAAWLQVLVKAGVAPAAAVADLEALVTEDDAHRVAADAEASGNPVVPLVALLRERLATSQPDAARWLHRGLTSQDVLDTAVVGSLAATREVLGKQLDGLVRILVALADEHRGTLMPGRTLTQHAVPITFGLKVAGWLSGVLDAREDLHALRLPVQVGGAAGTRAAIAELGDPAVLVTHLAESLDLETALPWHTVRTPLTRFADTLVRTTDALGHVANDVLVLVRPELGELAEPTGRGRGASSTMPQKANPVLSVLIRRAALSAPLLAAQLHVAAADQVDERAAGGWHTEWSVLSDLSRHTMTAASQAGDLLAGLRVDTARMATNLALDDLMAEQRSIADLTGSSHRQDPASYLGDTSAIIDGVLARAAKELQ